MPKVRGRGASYRSVPPETTLRNAYDEYDPPCRTNQHQDDPADLSYSALLRCLGALSSSFGLHIHLQIVLVFLIFLMVEFLPNSKAVFSPRMAIVQVLATELALAQLLKRE